MSGHGLAVTGEARPTPVEAPSEPGKGARISTRMRAAIWRSLCREMRTLAVGMLILEFGSCRSVAQTNSAASTTNLPASSQSEEIRSACIEGRRYVCGKVLQAAKDGVVVESGYADLLEPPLNKSWVVRGTATVKKPSNALEEKRPDAICVGTVFLTGIPKKPAVHEYDYVVLHAYPAGEYVYRPVPGVEKTVRRFSGSLELAVRLSLEK
jgi:hypothetical protein